MKEKHSFLICNNDLLNSKKIRWYGFCEKIVIDGLFNGYINNKYFRNIQTQEKLEIEFDPNKTTLIEIAIKPKRNISSKFDGKNITYDYTGYVKVIALYDADFLNSYPKIKSKKRNKIKG